MGEVTRFYDRISGQDGPVSGALQIIHMPFDSVTNETYVQEVNLPAGMGFEITDAYFTAAATGAAPALTIGDTAAGTQVVAAVTCTTDLGALTIKDGTIDAGGLISVVIDATASDTVTQGNLTLVGYVTSPPTTVAWRS